MKTYPLNFYGKNYNICLAKGNYQNNGTMAVLMYATTPKGKIKEEFGTLTVNIQDSNFFANDTDSQFIDTNNLGKDIVKWLEKNKIAESTGIIGFSGFCSYPLFQFTKQALENMQAIE